MARISGDEFVMIVHTADERVVAEPSVDADDLLAAADAAMYVAKRERERAGGGP